MGSNERTETLNEALQNVKHEAFQMKKDFDDGNIDSGWVITCDQCCEMYTTISFQVFKIKKIPLSLNHASLMLDRLRNTGYTPKQYNELFMTITNELRHLDIFIDDLFSRDHMVRNIKLLLTRGRRVLDSVAIFDFQV